MNDVTRATLIALINSIFPALEILGLISLTGDEIAQIMVTVSYAVTFLALVWKKGQKAGSATTVISHGEEG